jgi:hypothetical protein
MRNRTKATKRFQFLVPDLRKLRSYPQTYTYKEQQRTQKKRQVILTCVCMRTVLWTGFMNLLLLASVHAHLNSVPFQIDQPAALVRNKKLFQLRSFVCDSILRAGSKPSFCFTRFQTHYLRFSLGVPKEEGELFFVTLERHFRQRFRILLRSNSVPYRAAVSLFPRPVVHEVQWYSIRFRASSVYWLLPYLLNLSSPKFVYIRFKTSVPTSQENTSSHYSDHTVNAVWEKSDIYYETRTKPINTLWTKIIVTECFKLVVRIKLQL